MRGRAILKVLAALGLVLLVGAALSLAVQTMAAKEEANQILIRDRLHAKVRFLGEVRDRFNVRDPLTVRCVNLDFRETADRPYRYVGTAEYAVYPLGLPDQIERRHWVEYRWHDGRWDQGREVDQPTEPSPPKVEPSQPAPTPTTIEFEGMVQRATDASEGEAARSGALPFIDYWVGSTIGIQTNLVIRPDRTALLYFVGENGKIIDEHGGPDAPQPMRWEPAAQTGKLRLFRTDTGRLTATVHFEWIEDFGRQMLIYEEVSGAMVFFIRKSEANPNVVR